MSPPDDLQVMPTRQARTIRPYTLSASAEGQEPEWTITIPGAYEFRGVTIQARSPLDNEVRVWVDVSPGMTYRVRLRAFLAGEPIPDTAQYVGHFIAGRLVWHIYDMGSRAVR